MISKICKLLSFMAGAMIYASCTAKAWGEHDVPDCLKLINKE